MHKDRLKHHIKNPTQYKTPAVQRSMEDYAQRTPPIGGAPKEKAASNTDQEEQQAEARGRITVVAISMLNNFLNVKLISLTSI